MSWRLMRSTTPWRCVFVSINRVYLPASIVCICQHLLCVFVSIYRLLVTSIITTWFLSFLSFPPVSVSFYQSSGLDLSNAAPPIPLSPLGTRQYP
jgi:hypothetical protein